MMTDGEIAAWVVDITTDHYSPMPDDPDVLAIATQAKLANALQAENARLRAFVETIVNALGPYPYVNGTQLVMDAYRALAKPTGGTEL